MNTSHKAKVVFMMGAPGAGKSFIRERDYENLAVVEADRFKEKCSFYNPKNTGRVHAWSTNMARRAFFRALSEGNDFIFDGTGAHAEKYVAMINEARSAGFEIEICYVKVSLNTSLARNAARDRVVPEHVIREKHAMMPVAIDIVSGYADSIRIVNND